LSFYRITFGESSIVKFREASINRLGFSWRAIEERLDYENICEYEFSQLIQSLRDFGLHDEADSCYYRHREEMRKKRKQCKKQNCEFWINCQERERFYLKIRDWLSKWYCGYGVKLRNLITINIIFLIAWIFFYIHGINSADGPISNFYKDLCGNIIGWILMPLFAVILAKKLNQNLNNVGSGPSNRF